MSEIFIYPLLFILLSLSALFSASEIAFARSNSARLEKAAQTGGRKARLANYIDKNYTRSISAMLVGNSLVNIATSSAATVLFIGYIGESSGPAVAMAVTTVVVLFFGEVIPKIIATEYADRLVYYFALPIRFFMFLFAPVVRVVSAIVSRLEKHWTPKAEPCTATTGELVTMLETIEEEGVITESEHELIKSAIEFPDVTARDILTPRVDVAAFDIDDGIDRIFDDEDLLSYSRFPVYRESLDNIIGIMPTKILIKTAIADPDADLLVLLTPPVFVHMTRPISSILLEFRKTHSHMAVVIDEFGGVMGILTLEDILEELFGEIYDESDEEAEPFISASGSYEVDGGMNIYDMFELIGFDDRDFESEYTTVGGWATEMLDRFPIAGDSFEYKNLTVAVLEAEAMRVVKVRVDITDTDEQNPDAVNAVKTVN